MSSELRSQIRSMLQEEIRGSALLAGCNKGSALLAGVRRKAVEGEPTGRVYKTTTATHNEGQEIKFTKKQADRVGKVKSMKEKEASFSNRQQDITDKCLSQRDERGIYLNKIKCVPRVPSKLTKSGKERVKNPFIEFTRKSGPTISIENTEGRLMYSGTINNLYLGLKKEDPSMSRAEFMQFYGKSLYDSFMQGTDEDFENGIIRSNLLN